MRFHDGLAQCQPQAEAPSAVAGRIAAGVEKLKDVLLLVVRDARAFVRDADLHVFLRALGVDVDARAGRRVFDGVIQQVDHDLHDQPGISFDKQEFIRLLHIDGISLQPPAHMPHRFGDHIVDQFRGHVQVQAAVLHPAGGEQVFHHAGQPLCVVVNIGIQLAAGLDVQVFAAGQQVICAAHDGGQGRTQVVGYRPQQVGP